jgi:hypothetical protein
MIARAVPAPTSFQAARTEIKLGAGEGNRTPDLLITSDNLLVPVEPLEALLISEIPQIAPSRYERCRLIILRSFANSFAG